MSIAILPTASSKDNTRLLVNRDRNLAYLDVWHLDVFEKGTE